MSGVRQTLIPLTDRDAWQAALSGLEHAFAHTWESCHAMHLTSGWPTYLYQYEDGSSRAVCPLAERSCEGYVDVVTPYGFSGLTGTGECPGLLDHWREFAQNRGYVCGYIGLNPLLEGGLVPAADAYEYNEIFVLDLSRERDELFRALTANYRREVAKWVRAGEPLMRDGEQLAAFFLRTYPALMARRSAASTYAFRRETLEYLTALDSVLLLGLGDGEEPEAVAVFAVGSGSAEYLFAASQPGGERHSFILVWAGALELKRSGVRVLNLGGGIRKGDGVADFKRRFGGTRLPLRALKQVYDVDRFVELCRRADVDPADRAGYFPPYRIRHGHGYSAIG